MPSTGTEVWQGSCGEEVDVHGPDDPPKWITSAHAWCSDIETTSVHRTNDRDHGLATVIRWPCTLEVTVQNVEVRPDEYDRLHDIALSIAERRAAEEEP